VPPISTAVIPRSLIVLLAGLALLLVPGSASAARGLEVALQDDPVFVERSYYDRELAFQQARALGVPRLRVNVPWGRIVNRPHAPHAPRTIRYDFAVYDDLVANAARYGIKLQMTLGVPAPAWATADHRLGNRGPGVSAFRRFAGDVAAHFRGRVDRYSIFNEPNWHSWLEVSDACRRGHWRAGCDERAGSQYRGLGRAAYAAIKRHDRQAQVLIGELSPTRSPGRSTAPLAFLRAVTCSTPSWRAARRCPPLRADGFAHHPYVLDGAPRSKAPGPDDVTIGTLGRLTHALDRLARRGALRTPAGLRLDLYLTEYGYFGRGRRAIPPLTRARWLRESFEMARRNPRVRELTQYLLVQPPSYRDWFPTQIVGLRGRPTPAFVALSAWAQRNARHIAQP
jgi:hypothetical protein